MVDSVPRYPIQLRSPQGCSFPTTRWSIVLGLSTREAFAQLCNLYREPLLAFLRRKRYDRSDAEDAVQEFFAQLHATRALSPRGPGHGPFRSYLLGAFKHHVANAYRHVHALKRGGAVQFEPLENEEPAGDDANTSAEFAYERTWAIALLEQAMIRLEQGYVGEGRGALFYVLKGLLDSNGGKHAEVARELGVSEPTLRVALHRMRKRLAREVRAVIVESGTDPHEVESEVQYLASILWRARWSLSNG
jgi:RNA polymerase sigma factor (sigma-70 family)